MIEYKDLDWNSWIDSYEYWEDYIKVKFKTWTIYTYTDKSSWNLSIKEMINLAEKWDWLNTYININKPNYVSIN